MQQTDGLSLKSLRNAGGLLLAMLLMAGCGELAIKRGASGEDLAAARKICQAQGGNAAAMNQCLADKGWVIHDLNGEKSLVADPVIEASIIPSDQRIENAAGPRPGKVDGVAPAHVPTPAPETGSAHSTSQPAHPPDALDRFKISSWWKMGSGAASLQADTEACVATLGEVHRPNPQTQMATRGFLLCMKEKGWRGLRGH